MYTKPSKLLEIYSLVMSLSLRSQRLKCLVFYSCFFFLSFFFSRFIFGHLPANHLSQRLEMSVDIQEVRRGLFRMRWEIDDVTSGAYKETITLCGTQSNRSYVISCYPRQLRSARNTTKIPPFYIRLSVKETTLDDLSSNASETEPKEEPVCEPSGNSKLLAVASSKCPAEPDDPQPLRPEYMWVSRDIGDEIALSEAEAGTWRLSTFSVWKQPLTITFWMDFGTKTQGEKTIMHGLADLFAKQIHCDVQFQLKDHGPRNTVGAHVAVLSAGSPVFAAMFQPGFLESQTRKVVIEDIRMKVFLQLLTYLYTGKAPELEVEEVTQRLFEAADKYGVATLKRECVDVMLTRLTVDNVVSLLVWSHLHSIPQLYEAAMKFIAVNGRHLCFRPDWAQLMTDYPQLCLLATQRIVNRLPTTDSEDSDDMYFE
jgi:speckle-type POZ protein